MFVGRRLIVSKFFAILFGIIVTSTFSWLSISKDPRIENFINRLNYIIYDVRLRAELPPLSDVKNRHFIKIIDIDEKSLAEQGRWPWHRSKIAKLVEQLQQAGVVTIAFDMIFSEPEVNVADVIIEKAAHKSNQQELDLLKGIADEFAHDTIFAKQLTQSETILGMIFDRLDRTSVGQLPPALIKLKDRFQDNLTVITMPSYTAPIPILAEAATNIGFVTNIPDQDGVVRRSPVIIRYNDSLYGSLALIAMKNYLLIDNLQLQTFDVDGVNVLEGIKFGDYVIPTDEYGQVLVPYIGRSKSFPTISATDVINGRVLASELENTVVFIGSSALGLADLKPVPTQSVYPGVEVHASIAAGLMNNIFKTRPHWAKGLDFVITLVTGLLLSFLFPFLNALWILVITASYLLVLIFGDFWLWREVHLDLPISIPFLLVFTLGFSNLAYGFLSERFFKRQIQSMFSQYVPPAHIDHLLQHSETDTGFEGESRMMSVLFMDINNFTNISENMEPTRLKQMINQFFTAITDVIFKNNGTIDKYVGDLVMAFWGAPLQSDTHQHDAIKAALEMQQVTETLKPIFKEKDYPEVNVSIGVNSGMMNVGDMGSVYRRNYTVLGDSVNLASRLEGISRHYQAKIVTSQFTIDSLNDFVFRKLDKIRVKGKQEPVIIYEPLMLRSKANESLLAELASHEQALAAYFDRHWAQAESLFTELTERRPDVYVYQLYLQRIAELKQHPPDAQWDGTYTFTSKK